MLMISILRSSQKIIPFYICSSISPILSLFSDSHHFSFFSSSDFLMSKCPSPTKAKMMMMNKLAMINLARLLPISNQLPVFLTSKNILIVTPAPNESIGIMSMLTEGSFIECLLTVTAAIANSTKGSIILTINKPVIMNGEKTVTKRKTDSRLKFMLARFPIPKKAMLAKNKMKKLFLRRLKPQDCFVS